VSAPRSAFAWWFSLWIRLDGGTAFCFALVSGFHDPPES
jgi:hypothetical protein